MKIDANTKYGDDRIHKALAGWCITELTGDAERYVPTFEVPEDGKYFTPKQYAEARIYWGSLTDEEEQMFYEHYTRGAGKGLFRGVDEDTTFEDYQVISMLQTEFEIAHDI